jgi:hypothetical protein
MQKLSDAEFISAWRQCNGSPRAVMKLTGMKQRSVFDRRAALNRKGIKLMTDPAPGKQGAPYGWQVPDRPFSDRIDFTVLDGYAFFFGDAHYWPGEPSLAHQALLILLKRLKPKLVCANGDLFDGAGISRHDPLGWHKTPSVIDELNIVKQRMGEIERAAPAAERYFSPGNHDTRFDRRLATEISEFAGVPGMRLEDHLKEWKWAYVGVINEHTAVPVLVMHNFRGGVHAPWNNVLHAGTTIVTGHLHSQDRKGHTTYFKTAYGLDHGMLADPDHAAFSYTMGRPKNWRSGFAVIGFDSQGRHLPPEFLEVQFYKGLKRAVFRGEVIVESAG